jgi:hypothetical protein
MHFLPDFVKSSISHLPGDYLSQHPENSHLWTDIQVQQLASLLCIAGW